MVGGNELEEKQPLRERRNKRKKKGEMAGIPCDNQFLVCSTLSAEFQQGLVIGSQGDWRRGGP